MLFNQDFQFQKLNDVFSRQSSHADDLAHYVQNKSTYLKVLSLLHIG